MLKDKLDAVEAAEQNLADIAPYGDEKRFRIMDNAQDGLCIVCTA